MSLDLYLEAVRPVQVFEINVTHNLGQMAQRAGLYQVMWRPDDGLIAADALPILRDGLQRLLSERDEMEKLAPDNGWGTYDGLVNAVRKIIAACEDNPDATLRASA